MILFLNKIHVIHDLHYFVLLFLAQVGCMGRCLLFFHHLFEFTFIRGYKADVQQFPVSKDKNNWSIVFSKKWVVP